MAFSFGCSWQRNASVLLWTPIFLIAPLLELEGGPAMVAFQIALVAIIAGTAVVTVLTGTPGATTATPYAAFSTQVSATVAGTQHGPEWAPTWVLLAMTVPSVLRGRWLIAAVPAVAAAAMGAAWLVGASGTRILTQGFIVLLAGIANSSLIRLIDTVQELRRTREELARRAVAEERERFSRDLHDLLGHTLSVMVVKAQAVRRLLEQDPAAAATHAADIERVGRDALSQVRETVDAVRSLKLDDELDGARRALDAAGIRAEVSRQDGPVPARADEALAWVVREGATNVLRHSGAGRCSFELRSRDGQVVLTISDDGVGGPPVPPDRPGGLEGLRGRLVAVGGRLDVDPRAEGFRLTARVPHRKARS